MFEWVSNMFGGSTEQKPAPAAAPAPAPAPAPAADHDAHAAVTTPAAKANPDAGTHADTTTKPKVVDQKAMDAAANTIFKKMDGWWVSGSDKAGILDQLRGKSPDEVAAIKRSYAEHFPGHDMDSDLNKNLAGKDLQEAKASMSGDTVGAAVAAIKNAETGTWLGNVDSERVNTVLDSIKDPKQREEVRKQVGGELTKLQSGNDGKLTQALLAGDTATASAVRIDDAQHSWSSTLSQGFNKYVAGGLLGKDFGTDKDAINKAIEDCKSPEERKKLQDTYKANTGTDLNKDLDQHLDGANRTVATKLMEGDTNAANAAKMKAATEHWFTDKDAIYKAMEGKSETERKTMMADYKQMYGQEVNTMLDKELSGLDRQKAQELEDKGKLSDAFALKYAQEGSFWSTDKQLIKDTLAGKSKEQIAALQDDYKKKYGIDLAKELGETTSGRDGFEIKELMKGEPQTLDEKMERSRERYDFERGSGSNFMSKAICDTFSDKGKLLDAQQARAEELYKKIQSGSATSEEKQLLDRVTGYQNLDTKNYQESKDAVTNGAVAVAAVAAGAIATVATGGAAAPAEAAIIAALAAGGATIATKAIIQDSGYSNEELRNDIIMTGVNVATAGTMGALGSEGGALFNLASKASDNPLVQQAIIQGATGAVSTGVGNATQATLAGKSMPEILKAGGMGALTGGAGAATTGVLGAGLKGNQMFEGMDPVKAAMLRNAIAGGAGGAVSTAIDPESYKGDSAALIQKWGMAVGGGAFGGAAGGYNEGKIEVESAAKLKAAENEQQQTGKAPPTADEAKVLADAKEQALNPAEAKQIDNLAEQLKQGKTPDFPVEQDPTAVKAASAGKEEPKVVVAPKDEPVVAKSEPVVGPKQDPLAEPKQWAADQQKIANETPKLSAKQADALEAIKSLRADAHTAKDWETIRQFEAEYDIPTTMRTSMHDEQAALDVIAGDKSLGKHTDGTPVTQAEHDKSVASLQKELEPKTTAVDDAHAVNVEQRRQDAVDTYQGRDQKLADAVKGVDKVQVEEATIGLGLAGGGAAEMNPNTRKIDEHGMPKNIGLGQDNKPELWSTMPAKEEIGQPAANLDKGLPGLEAMAEHPTAQNARAGELAAAVAEQRANSGVTSLEVAGPLAPLEVSGVRDEHGKLTGLGTISTSADVQVGIDKTTGKPILEHKTIEMSKGVDFDGGMGPARELNVINDAGKGQITQEHADALKGSAAVKQLQEQLNRGEITQEQYQNSVAKAKVLLSGEEALALPSNAFEGENVLVIGGGPTAKWAGDHAMTGIQEGGKGGSVEVAGAMPKPDPKSDLGKAMAAKETEIKNILADKDAPPGRLDEARDEYHALVKKHIDSQTAELARLQEDVKGGQLSPLEEQQHNDQIGKLKRDLDPFMGSRVDRNESSLNDPNIGHMQMDISNVQKTEDGKALVTFADGTQKVYDRVIPGIGADANKPGGVANMLSKLPPDVKLVPVIENGRPIGLMSDPPGITISGAAAFGTTGQPPKEILARMSETDQAFYAQSAQEFANRNDVSHGSRGIVPGIENVGDTGAQMQLAKQKTPDERQAELDAWRDRYQTKQDRIVAYSDDDFWNQPVQSRDSVSAEHAGTE